MLDLLIHNASLPDGRTNMSVAVRGGRIVEVTAGLMAPAHETLDAQGQLLSPPFIDAHFHMDATLSYGLPRVNASGTLLEGIALWGELKPLLTQEALVERALAYCDWAVAKGLLAIRTHVDVCDPRLLAVDALLEVKRRVAPYIDMGANGQQALGHRPVAIGHGALDQRLLREQGLEFAPDRNAFEQGP